MLLLLSCRNKKELTIAQYKGSKLFEGLWLNSFTTLAWADINRDGKIDLIIGGEDGTLKYYQKTATSFEEKTGSDNPFDHIDVGYHSIPIFADLDRDLDLELVIGEFNGNLNYYDFVDEKWTQQIGDNNPFNDISVGYHSAPFFAHLDDDDDLELVIGKYDGTLSYYDLVDEVWTQQKGNKNPFNDIMVDGHSIPTFADLDDDLDLELVIGEEYRDLYYYDFIEGQWTEYSGSDNPFNHIHVGYYSAPSFSDIDNDKKLELIIGEEDGTLNYYNLIEENTWVQQTRLHGPFHDIDHNRLYSAPTFANLDYDEDLELVIGGEEGDLTYYDLVDGTWTQQKNGHNPFHHIDVGHYSTPVFANLDTDKDLELVIGEYDGTLNYYDLVDEIWTQQKGDKNPFHHINVGTYSTPIFIDFNRDNELELVVGESDGFLHYYTLVGEKWIKQTGPNNPFGNIDVGNNSALAFLNIDLDLDLELVIGREYGNLQYYDLVGSGSNNDGTTQTWRWARQEDQEDLENPFNSINVGYNSIPTFVNLDDDLDLELVIGSNAGGLIYGDLYNGEWVYFR